MFEICMKIWMKSIATNQHSCIFSKFAYLPIFEFDFQTDLDMQSEYTHNTYYNPIVVGGYKGGLGANMCIACMFFN